MQVHNVFISYSSKNLKEAKLICNCIEKSGISCWMSPRDVLPGSHWAASITQAIRNANILALLLSSSANDSEQVVREVNLAVSNRIPIVTMVLEKTEMSDSLSYYLSVAHWLDNNGSVKDMGQRLANVIQTLIHKGEPSKQLPALHADGLIDIYNAEMEWIGAAVRKQVHQLGLWHKTCHCWFYSIEEGKAFIWVQKRSKRKLDFPDLLDITAGRHLLTGETDRDGISKVSMELGVEVDFRMLTYLGVRTYSEHIDSFFNNEFNSVYIYDSNYSLNDFSPNPEEVSGILRVDASSLEALLTGKLSSIPSVGLFIENDGRHVRETVLYEKDFVPRSDNYYEKICSSVISVCSGGEATGI